MLRVFYVVLANDLIMSAAKHLLILVCYNIHSRSLFLHFQPMPQIDHNGPGFRYIVSYRRADRDSDEIKQEITDWEQNELVIDNQETFQEFEISVQSQNDRGECPVPLERKLGYSGEDGK